MRERLIALSVFTFLIFFLRAQQKNRTPALSQENNVITNPQKDTIKERDRATQILRNLKNGSVIVRLKTNQKSVDAYRKSGRNDIAVKIEADRKKQNEKLYLSFRNNFSFCKVYFIYSGETDELREGNNRIFLNQHLEHDSSIAFKDTNFVFCELGSAESFSKFGSPEKHDNVVPARTSTSPATTSGLVFFDKNLQQLFRPFPYIEGVYMENFDVPVRALNREMERAYGRLVIKKDFKEKIKQAQKKQMFKQ